MAVSIVYCFTFMGKPLDLWCRCMPSVFYYYECQYEQNNIWNTLKKTKKRRRQNPINLSTDTIFKRHDTRGTRRYFEILLFYPFAVLLRLNHTLWWRWRRRFVARNIIYSLIFYQQAKTLLSAKTVWLIFCPPKVVLKKHHHSTTKTQDTPDH